MKTALLSLFALLKPPLVRMLSSLKFWTVVFGVLTTQAAKYGLEVDEQTYWTIVGFFGLLLGGQGLADHGKEAAKSKPPIATEGGFVRLETMLAVLLCGVLAGGLVACGASARTKVLQTNLFALNTARDTVLEVSKTREQQIVADATSKEEGRAALDAWRDKVDPVVEALAKGYRMIAAAALLSDAESASEAGAAVVSALALVRSLK